MPLLGHLANGQFNLHFRPAQLRSLQITTRLAESVEQLVGNLDRLAGDGLRDVVGILGNQGVPFDHRLHGCNRRPFPDSCAREGNATVPVKESIPLRLAWPRLKSACFTSDPVSACGCVVYEVQVARGAHWT